MAKGKTPVVPFSAMVWSPISEIVGGSFTAVTVTATGSASVAPSGSEATKSICVTPFSSGAGVIESVHVPGEPATKETLAWGISVVLAEVATRVKSAAGVSASVTVIVTVMLGVSSAVVIGSEIEITGDSSMTVAGRLFLAGS